MKFLAIAVVFLFLTIPVFAADVDGKWSGSLAGPQGEIQIGFTFKADGAALSGSMVGPDGTEIAFKDGKIDGSNISFSVTIDFGGMPFVLAYTGVVAPDEIKLTGDFAGMPFQFVVKKVK